MKKSKEPVKTYDVVAVLCGGLQKIGNDYIPTTFSDSDEFGMLGGHVRPMAAAQLYGSGACNSILFSTGVSAKQIEKFGPDVPAEAYIYRDAFLRDVTRLEVRQPADVGSIKIFIEDESVNTVGNIEHIVQMCIDNNWQHVGILSSDYHIPRIRAHLKLLMEQTGLTMKFEFLLSESILKAAHPNMYDSTFEVAYNSPEGQKRLVNERKGLMSIESGRYVFSEFQLARK